MKKASLILCISCLSWACGSSTSGTMNKESPADQKEAAAAGSEKTAHAKTDPVCGMPEDGEAFTDFSVYQGDTSWFCSPHCKEQFDKDPTKYAKK